MSGPSGAAPPPGAGAANLPGARGTRGDAAATPCERSGEPAREAAGAEVRPPRASAAAPALLTFSRLKWASFTHSAIYLALLLSAFAAGKPEPLTEALGWTHGVLWISMSAACLTAARRRVVPLRVAVAVAVLGGVGPFFGSLEFAREQRRRLAAQAQNAPR